MSTSRFFDPAARFVRIVSVRDDGIVEFEFAIGEPGLFVEMLMPRAQFDEFCATQRVTPTVGPRGEPSVEWDWTLRDAREQRFRSDI